MEYIEYFHFPRKQGNRPFKYRISYNFIDGSPHRWMELDSARKITTEYIYTYNENGQHVGAKYREDGVNEYSIEKVRFENDSTQITEWLDSTGIVYYSMIDNLNKKGKTYRATFIGDELHGFDSTFYTKEGFEKRIFFTNTKGKVYNDRMFNYDKINKFGDWESRKKIMSDTVREIQIRELVYDKSFSNKKGIFYPGVLSNGEWSENLISFNKNEDIAFFTRTKDWNNQYGYIARKENGIFTDIQEINDLGPIYNGAISPNTKQIICSIKNLGEEEVWLIEQEDNIWSKKRNLSKDSGIQGGYFYWHSDNEIFFQSLENLGDIKHIGIVDNKIEVLDNLAAINTKATEFSPYVDPQKRFLIFTRYDEIDLEQRGFFISYNQNDAHSPEWLPPERLNMLPYGWGANMINNQSQFVYTDGDDFFSIPSNELLLDLSLTK